MLKDITLGQYYPGTSYLHSLDPRAKLICLFLYMIGLFLVTDLSGFLTLAPFTLLIITVSGVPFKTLMRGIKPMWLLFALTILFNFFMTNTGTVVWQWRFVRITDEGLVRGIYMAIRLILLLNVTALLTLTTTPIRLTDGLEHIMKRCFVPMAHELAMMMTIALRFIPTLIEETERIMNAQIARGADFESGNLLQKGKNLIPLLIPLFVSAFRRADELAMAMEARCYHGGEGRTRLHQLKYEARDGVAFFCTACFLSLTIYFR